MNNSRLKDGFGMCSWTVMRDPTVNITDKAVYAYLCTFASSVTNELHISVNTIAADMDLSVITVKRSLKRLEEQGIISRFFNGHKTKTTRVIK